MGPSPSAEGTGQVLPLGVEGHSEMMWSVKGWPGDRGQGDKKFVLLKEMGWVQVVAGNDEAGLVEIEFPQPSPTSRRD